MLPDTVREIGTAAFGMCYALQSIHIPSGVASIERSAFGDCTSLVCVELPEQLKAIGDYAFNGCSALESLVIPAGVTSIGQEAFANCDRLVLRVHQGSFAETYARENGIPYRVIEIEENPWMQAPVLHTLEATSQGGVRLAWTGNGVADIYVVYELMPEGYESLRDTVQACEAILFGVEAGAHTYIVRPAIANGKTMSIGEASNAMTIELDPSVWPSVPVWNYADETAPNVFTLRWTGEADLFMIIEYDDNNVESIAATATSNEIQLTGVASGLHRYAIRAIFNDGRAAQSSIRGITAFGQACSLMISDTELTLYAGQPGQLLVTVSPFGTLDREVIWLSANEAVATVDETGLVTGVAEGTTTITVTTGNGVTASCTVTVVTNSFTTEDGFVVENGALVQYTGTASHVVVPDDLGIWKVGVDGGGFSVFPSCVISLTLPEGLRVIGRLWQEYPSIEEVIVPDSVTEIADYAFYYAPSGSRKCELKHIGPLNGVKRIGFNAFYNCQKLESISLPVVEEISDQAFMYCHALSEVELPDRIENGNIFATRCFQYSGITTIDIPDGTTEINTQLFYTCTKLQSVTLPDSLKVINSSAFEGCSSLCEIDLPKNLAEIKSQSFKDCISLDHVILPEGIEVSFSAYRGCSGLRDIVVPANCMIVSQSSSSTHGVFEASKTGDTTMHIAEGAVTLDPALVRGLKGLRHLYLPQSIESLDIRSIIPKDVIFHGISGSYADTYATMWDFPFVPLDSDEGEFPSISNVTVVTDDDGNVLMGTGMTLSTEALFGVRKGMYISQGKDSGVASVGGLSLGVSITALAPGYVEVQAKVNNVVQTRRIRVVGGFDQKSIVVIDPRRSVRTARRVRLVIHTR